MQNRQIINVNIPNEKLILSFKKARQAVIPTRIQALVIIHQRLDGMKDIFHLKFLILDFLVVTLKPLCYCRFPLYIPQKIGNLDTWDMTFGSVKRALHPGIPPIAIDMIPDIPKTFAFGM
jgi:hypothetical protein